MSFEILSTEKSIEDIIAENEAAIEEANAQYKRMVIMIVGVVLGTFLLIIVIGCLARVCHRKISGRVVGKMHGFITCHGFLA